MYQKKRKKETFKNAIDKKEKNIFPDTPWSQNFNQL